jgi:hypothetical protein
LPASGQTKRAPDAIHSIELESLYLNGIPLNRNKSGNQIKYISALAFKLAPKLPQPDPDSIASLATQLIHTWIQFSTSQASIRVNPFGQQFWDHLILSQHPPGWLQFHLLDPGIAAWLQILLEHIVSEPQAPRSNPCSQASTPSHNWQTSEGFTILQTHARCSTLLNLGSQTHPLPWNQIRQPNHQSSLPCPDPAHYPWLTDQQQLRLETDAEWSLLLQISDTMDRLAQLSPAFHLQSIQPQPVQSQPVQSRQLFKIALTLSQAFQKMDAACPIGSALSPADSQLTIARLGLVQLTQWLLQLLIETGSPYLAPFAL